MDELTRTRRRTRAYWWVDGIAESVGGAVLALVGALLYLSQAESADGLATLALMTMIVGFPVSAKIIGWIKERITYPRTGYVKYPKPDGTRKKRSFWIAGGLGFAIALVATVTGNPGFEGAFGASLTAGLGFAVAAALAVRAASTAMPRFYISAAAVVGAAMWSVYAEHNFIMALGVMWIVLGLVSVLTGGVALTSYMRAHPRPEADPS